MAVASRTLQTRFKTRLLAARTLASLAAGLLLGGLTACTTYLPPAPALPPVPAACCAQLNEVPDEGLLRNGRLVKLDRQSRWFAFDTGLAPVSAWQLPFPHGELTLELVVPLAPLKADLRQPLPLLKVSFIDGLGQILPTQLVGPRAEQSTSPQVRWWVEVPTAAEKVLIGVDASEAGRMFSLNITEPGVSAIVSGIRLQGADVLTPVPLRASLEGRVKLVMH